MPNEDGTPTEFELLVAGLYRASGALVEHNKLVGGNQIDVWVEERTAAGTSVRLVVECKKLSRPVGIAQVNSLATKVNLLRGNRDADLGVLVANSQFTTAARDAAAKNGIRLVTIADLQHAIQAPTRVAVDDVRRAVTEGRRLSAQMKDTLRSPATLTPFELDGLHADITKALNEYRTIMDRHRITPPGNAEIRRALSCIVRLEEATDQTLDALYYFRRVDEAISEAANGLPPAGRTEADYAAASSIRLRDLEQARTQLRFRLRRLEETCDRLLVD